MSNQKQNHTSPTMDGVDARSSSDLGDKLPTRELFLRRRQIQQYVQILCEDRSVVVTYGDKGTPYTAYLNKEAGTKYVHLVDSVLYEEGYESACGTALHEASHVVKSNLKYFDTTDTWFKKRFGEVYLSDNLGAQEPEEELDSLKENFRPHILKTLVNIVEDRRVDAWAYTVAPGYKKFYRAMYELAWNSEDSSKKLEEADTPSLQSYMTHICFITNDNFKLDRLPGLAKMYEVFDPHRIDRLEETRDAFEVACKLYVLMFRELDFEEIEDKSMSELKCISDELADYLKNIMHDFERAHGSLDDTKSTMLDEVDDKNTKMDQNEEGDGVPLVDVMVYENVPAAISAGVVDGGYDNTIESVVREGLIMGKQLRRKLHFRNDRRTLKTTRQNSGRLDGSILSEISFNNRLFYEEEVETHAQELIHLSIDASGSMRGKEFHRAVKCAVAIAKACHHIKGMRVQISFRYSSVYNGGPMAQLPFLIMAYDSAKQNIKVINRDFPRLNANGSTPAGLLFKAIRDRILSSGAAGFGGSDVNRYYINLSDGRPSYSGNNISYRGNVACSHTRDQVQKMRKAGIHVMGYFISDSRSDSQFSRMYGSGAKFINVGNIVDIAKSLIDMQSDKNHQLI